MIVNVVQNIKAYATYALLSHDCLVQDSREDVAYDDPRMLDTLAHRDELVLFLRRADGRVVAPAHLVPTDEAVVLHLKR